MCRRSSISKKKNNKVTQQKKKRVPSEEGLFAAAAALHYQWESKADAARRLRILNVFCLLFVCSRRQKGEREDDRAVPPSIVTGKKPLHPRREIVTNKRNDTHGNKLTIQEGKKVKKNKSANTFTGDRWPTRKVKYIQQLIKTFLTLGTH